MAGEAWIIDAVRSPRGRAKETGSLYPVHPQRLLAQVLNALKDRVGLDTDDVDDVVMGTGSGTADHANDIARLAALDAGWSIEAPGVTLNRFCGSGQQAINFAAMGVLSGFQNVVVAGGVEMMSRGVPATDKGFAAGNDHLFARFPMVPQGIAADLLATLDDYSREDCDRIAYDSQERAATAIAEGRFERSMVPIYHDDGTLALDHEEHPRPGTTMDTLATLAPSFEKLGTQSPHNDPRTYNELALAAYPSVSAIEHVHHAGNSSGRVDGASALLVTSPDYAQAHGLTPRARIRMTDVIGAEPVLIFTAPAPATKRCVKRAGMTLDDIDLFEFNEAFAAPVLRFLRDTGVDWDKVNVNGGAIALGHPIGATGGTLIATVLDELERRDLTTGLVAMCTGGAMATVTIIERI